MSALARKLHRLPPELAQRVRLKPAEYVELIGTSIAGGHKASSRLCFEVLHAIALRADWSAGTWGAGAYRAAESIAEDLHYCERSVRYAFRALVDGGWLHIDERAGRTHKFTVLRPVEPIVGNPAATVHDWPKPVDDPVDNRPAGRRRGTLVGAGGGAPGAPDQGYLPTDTPPVSPPSALMIMDDGADAPADAAPGAPRRARGPSGTGPPSSAGPGARPHREDAGAGGASERAGPSPGAPSGPLYEPPATVWGEPRLSRTLARRYRRCVRCGASPGEPCINRAGRPRNAVHAERRVPKL